MSDYTLTRTEMELIAELTFAVRNKLAHPNQEHIDEAMFEVREDVRMIIRRHFYKKESPRMDFANSRDMILPKGREADRFESRLRDIAAREDARKKREEIQEKVNKIRSALDEVEHGLRTADDAQAGCFDALKLDVVIAAIDEQEHARHRSPLHHGVLAKGDH